MPGNEPERTKQVAPGQLVKLEVETIVTQAKQQLGTIDVSPFSVPAFEALQKNVGTYIAIL